MRSSYFLLPFIAFSFIMCNKNQRYEYVFRFDDVIQYGIDLDSQKKQITEQELVIKIASCLGDSVKYYGNYFQYYYPLDNPNGHLSVIRADDYSIRQYLVLENPVKCIEVASDGGDGAELFRSFSYVRNDSIFHFLITETYTLDEETDMFSDIPPRIDTLKTLIKMP